MKKQLYIIYICMLFVGIFSANAQTYPIPDINLRNALIKNYPSFMTVNGELIIDSAKATSRDLNFDNSNISNADGIQFFVSTGILRLRNNNLTSIPQLSSMRNLRRIYLSNNHITSIPNISALYQLIDLYIVNNNITELSSITGKTTLQYLTCSGNQITTLPDITALINLQSLIVSYNPISLLPDVSANVNLKVLDIRNTNIHSVPSLAALTNLTNFNCENTHFNDLSGLTSITTLVELTAQNNNLASLPNLSNKLSLATVNISNNNLTFEDIIPLTLLPNLTTFMYAPQQDLVIPLYVNEREPNSYSYQLSIDPLISNNQFTWYKGNTPIVTNNTGTLSFTTLFMSDSGFYYVKVANTNAPLLELKSNTSQLIVRPCIEINTLNTTILSSDCRTGSTIDFAGTTVDGSTNPMYYILENTSNGKQFISTDITKFNNIIPGTYVLKITDAKNCSTSKKYYLDKGEDCQSAFSPNGDGIMDDYFIPDTGTAQIFSTSKKLIRTLTLPGSWDGTTNDGGMADAGYYVIVINGSSTIDLSLMR
jgi:internalin A